MKRYTAPAAFLLGAIFCALSINYGSPKSYDLFKAFLCGCAIVFTLWEIES